MSIRESRSRIRPLRPEKEAIYTKPWTVKEQACLRLNTDVIENACENNLDLQHLGGQIHQVKWSLAESIMIGRAKDGPVRGFMLDPGLSPSS